MIKINSLILILLILFLILNNSKKEKYENTKKDEKLKNDDKKIKHKIVSNENFSAFNKNDQLDKSSEKFNLENKITLKNHLAKKIDFNYDELEDISNKNIKNFKYDTDEQLKENFIYDINENNLDQDMDLIKEKSNELVEKSTKFYDIDDKNEKILEKMSRLNLIHLIKTFLIEVKLVNHIKHHLLLLNLKIIKEKLLKKSTIVLLKMILMLTKIVIFLDLKIEYYI